MKIILRADVENLGMLGDQVDVKPGYARNYLIPQGMAMVATQSNLKVFENERKKLETAANEKRSEAATLGEKLAAAEVVIPVRVGEGDKLYGSVTAAMIGDALAEMGIEIDKRKVVLDAPIRSLGIFEIPVKLHADVKADLKVAVIREGGSVEDLVAAEEEEVTEEAAEEVVEEVTESAEAETESAE